MRGKFRRRHSVRGTNLAPGAVRIALTLVSSQAPATGCTSTPEDPSLGARGAIFRVNPWTGATHLWADDILSPTGIR